MNLNETLKTMSGASATTVRRALGARASAAKGRVEAIEVRATWRFESGAELAQVLDLTRLDEPAVHPRDARPATLAVRVKTQRFDETHAVDVAVYGGREESYSGLTALARDGLDPQAPEVQSALSAALAAHVDPYEDGDAERARVLGVLTRGLDPAERVVDPERVCARETRTVMTGADAGGVRLTDGGEGTALQLRNGAGDGDVMVTVGPDGPEGTRPIEGVAIAVVSEDVYVTRHDCQLMPAMGLKAGLYAAHNSEEAEVWLEPTDTVADGPYLEVTPASGAWRARVSGRYIGERRRGYKGWESALWVTLEGAECEFAPGALHLRTSAGDAWTIHHAGNSDMHIDIERHRDGRVRILRY